MNSVVTAAILVSASLLVAPVAVASGSTQSVAEHWVASWTASPTDSLTPVDAAGFPVPEVLLNQTLRMIVTPHRSGAQLRLISRTVLATRQRSSGM